MEDPTRYLREGDGWRYPLAENFFAGLGLDYRLRSAAELPIQYVQNLSFLGDYLDVSHPALEDDELHALREVFKDNPSVYLRHLLDDPKVDADAVYKAIADRLLAFDLYNDNLGETDRVMVYRDAPTMEFLRRSIAPSVGLPQERLDGTIEPGGKIFMDKKEYEILFVDGEALSATYQGKVVEVPLHIVEDLYQRGVIKLTPGPLIPHGTEVDASRLKIHSPGELDAALQRAKWLEQATIAPKSVPYSQRTLQRYRREVNRVFPARVRDRVS